MLDHRVCAPIIIPIIYMRQILHFLLWNNICNKLAENLCLFTWRSRTKSWWTERRQIYIGNWFKKKNAWVYILVTRGGNSAECYMGRLCSKVQPLTLSYTVFDLKGTLFIYLLLTNGPPYHIPSLELCIPFNCC